MVVFFTRPEFFFLRERRRLDGLISGRREDRTLHNEDKVKSLHLEERSGDVFVIFCADFLVGLPWVFSEAWFSLGF